MFFHNCTTKSPFKASNDPISRIMGRIELSFGRKVFKSERATLLQMESNSKFRNALQEKNEEEKENKLNKKENQSIRMRSLFFPAF